MSDVSWRPWYPSPAARLRPRAPPRPARIARGRGGRVLGARRRGDDRDARHGDRKGARRADSDGAAAVREGRRRGRQGRLRGERLRRLPHPRGRGREGHRRAEPRRRQADARARRRPPAARQGRDAVVQGPAHPGPDRGRRGVRGEGNRRRRLIELPDSFPRDLDVVATDLDHTLIWDDGVLRPRTQAALAAAREAGLRVVVVTGRMVQSLRRVFEETGLPDAVVCYQGAVVADSQGRWLRHVPIEAGLAREVIAAVGAEGYEPNVYVDDKLYVARVTPEATAYASFQGLEIHAVGDLGTWIERDPTKLVCVGDPDALEGLGVRMRERFAGRLHITKSLPYFLEFATAGVTKGTGLGFLAEHLGFTAERTIAFGDGENDVELLEWAGYAVAVENAHRRVKEVADWICPPAAEQGVAQVIEALIHSRS